MLLVRDIHFLKINGILYLVGSSSNHLYMNHIYQMGKISLLAWITEDNSMKTDKLVPLLQSPDIEIIELPNNLTFFEKIKKIKKFVKEADSLSIKFCFIDSFIACHYAKKFSKPYVIESGTDAFASSWYHGGGVKYKVFAYPYEQLTRYYHATSKFIIYVSKFFLQKKYPSKAFQLGCSDTVLPDVPKNVLDIRLERINHQQKYTLGLIGSSSVEYRGHDTLIYVLSELRKRGHDITVRFAGSKSGINKRTKLSKSLGINDFVSFDGYMTQEEIFNWIDEIDILVMPTLQETLGRAVIEAMSRGCPVIGSAETALPEQIGSDCIAPARNVKAIADIIENMIINKTYMKLCAIENYWRAKKYSNEITNNLRKDFYDEFYRRNGL